MAWFRRNRRPKKTAAEGMEGVEARLKDLHQEIAQLRRAWGIDQQNDIEVLKSLATLIRVNHAIHATLVEIRDRLEWATPQDLNMLRDRIAAGLREPSSAEAPADTHTAVSP